MSKQNIMRRVRTVYAVRPLVSTLGLSAALLLFALWGIGREVWVAHVVQNMPAPEHVAALSRFLVAAFLTTRFVVQAFTVLALGAATWLIYDGVRTLRYALRRFA